MDSPFRGRQLFNHGNGMLPVELKNQLKDAIKTYSFRENHQELFTLASGKKSPYYFDLKQTLLQSNFLKIAGMFLAEKIAAQFSDGCILAGLTMGADPLIYAACLSDYGLNHFSPAIVRKETKDHGTGKRIEMLKSLDQKFPCVMIDDVITTGGSTLKAVTAMRDAGYRVETAFCVLDRLEGGAENLRKEEIQLFPLFTLDDFKSR